ncbi:hypothetical protein D9757_005170 [Collybiopsis confluens]|uniref:Uncharacterized protein n=1 Tax=Collybiopsis confluens TaxID=2823264 RepID=A0A8H5MDG0_9AGAR|nr:hypothetical protein D9757_005170 [Collybiopsis confluens]
MTSDPWHSYLSSWSSKSSSRFLQQNLTLDLEAKIFSTPNQQTALMDRRTKLMRLMGRIRSIQALYMPAAIQRLGQRQVEGEEYVEDVPIFFPSTLSPAEQTSGCQANLEKIEEQLREAQIRGSLDSLRNHLHMKSRLLTYRKSNVKAQSMITKSQTLLKRNQRQIDGDAHRYRAAWFALESVRGSGRSGWKKLAASDVRMMDGGEDRALGLARKRLGKKKRDAVAVIMAARACNTSSSLGGDGEILGEGMALCSARDAVGKGYRETSWIWKEGRTGNLIDNQAVEEFIRVEWCKSFSRVQRWEEECELIVEEKRRTLVSLEHEAKLWESRQRYVGRLAVVEDVVHAEGVAAYARRQAYIYRSIAATFHSLWKLPGGQTAEEHEGDLDGASEDEEEEEAGILGVDDMADIPEDS